jgi:hypothetical protein
MRYILIILIALVSFSQAKAQTFVPGATLIGIKGGYTLSNLWGSNVGDSLSNGGSAKSKSGFNLGVGANSMLGKCFWLKHEVFLVKKGSVLSINDGVHPTYKSNLNLLYVDIYPCSPTFHYKGLQLFVGPYLGALTRASMQRMNSAGNLYTDKSIYGNPSTFKHYTQRIDLGFVAGLEYEFNNGLNISVRYVRGFVPLLEEPLTQIHQLRIYNKSLSFSVGYTFGREKGLKIKKKNESPPPPGY